MPRLSGKNSAPKCLGYKAASFSSTGNTSGLAGPAFCLMVPRMDTTNLLIRKAQLGQTQLHTHTLPALADGQGPEGGPELQCTGCPLAYRIDDGIPVLLENEARPLTDEELGL